MLLDRINPFTRTVTVTDLARRASIESPVELVGIRQVSEHEAFGLAGASPGTIRRSCWPVQANDAPELERALAEVAANMTLPDPLATNLRRLDRIRDHYRAVVAGEARLADIDFTTTIMRPFVTWLRALENLADAKYDRCGPCAEKLQQVVVSADFDGHFTVRQLGTTDDLAAHLDARATAAYMLGEIEPLLRDFHHTVESEGAGSAALESRIECLSGSASASAFAPARRESFGSTVHNPLYGMLEGESSHYADWPRASRSFDNEPLYASLVFRSMGNLSVSDSTLDLSSPSMATSLLR